MRTRLLALAIMVAQLASAQVWCPPGATWWYDYEDMTVGRAGVFRLTFVGDTVVDGFPAQQMALYSAGVYLFTQEPFIGQGLPVIMRDDNGAVSHWDGGEWRLVFDLSQPPGGGWILSGDNILDHEVLVVDTGHVQLDGTDLRYAAVEITRPNGSVILDTVVERLGFKRIYLEPWRSLMLEADVDGLRCYSDQQLSFTRANVSTCDYVMSTSAPGMVQAPILFHDPIHDALVVGAGASRMRLAVFDAMGRMVMPYLQASTGAPIDVSALSPGTYTALAYTAQGERVVAKWVKP